MKILLAIELACVIFCLFSERINIKRNQIKKIDNRILADRQIDNNVFAIQSPLSLTFLDSVMEKRELLISQIKMHTVLDSIYYIEMNANVGFSGDTVISLRNQLKGAIINYDDKRSCIYKFLFIFTSTGSFNTDYKIIKNDCDRDESADYLSIDYKFLNDSIFETFESLTLKHLESVSEVKKCRWKVTGMGAIDIVH